MIAEVFQEKGKWHYRIFIKYSQFNVVRKRKGGFPNEESARLAMQNLLDSLEQGKNKPQCSLNDTFDKFMKTEAKENRSESTRLRYYSVYKNHLVETPLGKESVDQITTTMVQTYLDEKRKTYAEEYVRGIYNLLLVIFHYAVSAGYIKETPMEGVKSPAISRDDKLAIFTDEQLSQLLDRLQSTSLVPAVMLGLHLGVKANECYAIRWSDIDFEKNTVKIDK